MKTLCEEVPRQMDRRLRLFLEALEAALESGNFADLHAARIAGKRLRYEIDFFRPLLVEQPASRAYKILTQLQDRLGFIADATAFDDYYEELLGDLDDRDPRRPGLISRKSENIRERAEGLVQLRAFWNEGTAVPGATLAASIGAALASLESSSKTSPVASPSETAGETATAS
jgi:CHAD domain-containing protein